MTIRSLGPEDAAEFHALRLRGLKEFPGAFASSFEEEESLALQVVAQRLNRQEDRAVFGAYSGTVMCGVVGIQREAMAKLRHKAVLWGMYVAPEARGRGVGEALISHALHHAWTSMQVLQVNLGAPRRSVWNRGSKSLVVVEPGGHVGRLHLSLSTCPRGGCQESGFERWSGGAVHQRVGSAAAVGG